MRHHRADLVLLRSAGTDDGLFDHRWSVLGDVELRLLRRQQDDASGMAQHERRTHVLMIEGILEREYRWLVPLDELCDLVVQLGETKGQGVISAKPKHTAFDETAHPGSPIPRFDHAVTRD